MKNKTITIQLENGETVGLTLTFGLLYRLRAKHKEKYEKYDKIVMEGIKDMMDYPVALYTAYLCKCVEDNKEPDMTEEEFIQKLPYNMTEVVKIYGELYNAEKKLRLEDHLSAGQEK